jgi:tetratricopeptide (TPR) repeat protein
LAERAGRRLAAAGRRALSRGDIQAAGRLLERAGALTRPIRFDLELELHLAATQLDPETAAQIANAAAERAAEAGDENGQAVARIVALYYGSLFEAHVRLDALESLARATLPKLEQARDHANLVHVWSALADVAGVKGQFDQMAQASEQALLHAELAGVPHSAHSDWFPLDTALVYGPRPADEALQIVEAVLHERPHRGTVFSRAFLMAMLGRFDDAWYTAREASERYGELRGDWTDIFAEIAILAGDEQAAPEYLQLNCEFLERHGYRGRLSTYAPKLGRSLCALGRYDEAEPLAELGRELGDEQDLMTQALWRQVSARVQAHRGEHAEAERLARDAVAILGHTDALNTEGDALCDLAEVLNAAGRADEAVAALEQALDRYQRKKNVAMVAHANQRLHTLHVSDPPT